MIKILKSFPAIALIAIILSSCSNYGKEYKLDDKHNIYYKGDGLDEAIAKKLANYLKEQDYFQDSISSTVQITKNKDTFNLNFVVDKEKITEQSESVFLMFGAMISESVFNKSPVTIQLTNNQLKPFKNLGYAKPFKDESMPSE